MAKSLVLILSLFFTVQAFLNIPDDTWKQTATECLNQNGLDYDTLEEYLQNKIPYSDSYGPVAVCIGKGIGVFNDKLEYMRDVVVQDLQADGKDSDEANTIADQCNIQKNSPEETVHATLMCLYQNDP